MAQTYKRLGAVDLNGTIGTAELIYDCPDSTSAIVSSIVVCNRDSAGHTYRLGVSTSSSYEDSGMLVYGATVPANDSITLTLGVVLDATNDNLLASADSTLVSVSAFGVENS
jgi:hypothetical protein